MSYIKDLKVVYGETERKKIGSFCTECIPTYNMKYKSSIKYS